MKELINTKVENFEIILSFLGNLAIERNCGRLEW